MFAPNMIKRTVRRPPTLRGSVGIAVRLLWVVGILLLATSLHAAEAPAAGNNTAGDNTAGNNTAGDDRTGDDAKIEQFLVRLGLTDLQVMHLENTLAKDLPPKKQMLTARRLADLYAALMLDDKDNSAQWLAKIRKLVQDFPAANTPSLRVSLLQADYDKAERAAAKWITDPTDLAARDAAKAALAKVLPQLVASRQQLEGAVDTMVDVIDATEDEDLRAAKERDLAQLEGVLRRATYFTAWAQYYSGVLHDDPVAAAALFKSSRLAFRSVLNLPEDPRDDQIEPDAFDLASIWQTRTLIGLGMAEAAAGNLEDSRTWFEILAHPRVPPAIRDIAAFYQIQGLMNAGKLAEARNLASARIREFGSTATEGKVSLCVAMIRTGFADEAQTDENAKSLGMLGVAGLAKIQQYGLLRKMIDKYEIEPDANTSFLLKSLKGQELFSVAEKSKRPEDYRAALEHLETALAAGGNADRSSIEECRYTIAWCRSRLGEHEKAAQMFRQVSSALKVADAETAVAAAWKAVESYRKLAEEDKRYVFSAVETLEAIRRDFPNHPMTEKVAIHIAKLRRAKMTPDELLEKLSQVSPESSSYASARYDICILRQEQWVAARGTPDEAAAATKLRADVKTYLAASADRDEDDRRLRCMLSVVNVALSEKPAGADEAKSLLAKAERLAAAMPKSSPLAADYHYRAFQLAKVTGDEETFQKHAAWLMHHAKSSGYQMPALVAMARHYDAAASKATGLEQPAMRREACSVYNQLVTALGDSPQVIGSQKNALVANSKLAGYLSLLGRHDEAAERLEKILAAYPKDKKYLQRAGVAHYNAGNFEQSIGHWRTLLRGLTTASDEWYEAKYYQVACLKELDPSAAASVFGQFQLLHPELGSAAWRKKFGELGIEPSVCGSAAPASAAAGGAGASETPGAASAQAAEEGGTPMWVVWAIVGLFGAGCVVVLGLRLSQKSRRS